MASRVGKRLRKLRGDKTQAEVAKDLNISPAAVSAYENGDRVPRDQLKKKIAKYYDTTVEAIFF